MISQQILAQSSFITQFSAKGLVGCNSNGGLSFADGTSQANIATVTAAAAKYDWTGATLTAPQLEAFLTDCLTDPATPNYPTALIYCIAISNPLLTSSQRKALVSAGRVAITAAYPSQAAGIIAQIETYLNNRHVPYQ